MSDHGDGGAGHSGHSGNYGHGHGHGAAPSGYTPAGNSAYWGPSPYTGSLYHADWPYAGWGSRVGAYLLDMLAACGPVLIAVFVGGIVGVMAKNAEAGRAVAVVLAVAALVRFGYDRYVRAGRTGQSLGKSVLGIRLVDERTGQPIGAGKAFVRDLAHVIDSVTFDIGFLMPLWDSKRQTIADKIAHTVVVEASGHAHADGQLRSRATPAYGGYRQP